MRRPIAVLAMLIAGSTAASAATDDEFRQLLVGSWSLTAACDGDRLTFNADGTFAFSDASGNPVNSRDGTYRVADGKLTGESAGSPMPEVTLSVQGETVVLTTKGGSKDTIVRCGP
ncbi:MAG: hypothetical protein F9K43_08005 [Bauldia sp.]|nr:MAG: hypothetical protein F9K43_08005 [Bauldia sp.]